MLGNRYFRIMDTCSPKSFEIGSPCGPDNNKLKTIELYYDENLTLKLADNIYGTRDDVLLEIARKLLGKEPNIETDFLRFQLVTTTCIDFEILAFDQCVIGKIIPGDSRIVFIPATGARWVTDIIPA